jgi:hypothetical protein
VKHFPAKSFHPPIEGLSIPPRPRLSLTRKTLLLVIAVAFASGLFTGAIAFGEVLVRDARRGAPVIISP